jgi:hypothetical protein
MPTFLRREATNPFKMYGRILLIVNAKALRYYVLPVSTPVARDRFEEEEIQ